MATSPDIAPRPDLNALLAAAAVEQDSSKLCELTNEILAAFERGESATFTEG